MPMGCDPAGLDVRRCWLLGSSVFTCVRAMALGSYWEVMTVVSGVDLRGVGKSRADLLQAALMLIIYCYLRRTSKGLQPWRTHDINTENVLA